MSMSAYSELLKDPRWQKKRLEVLEAHGWKCDNCEDETTTFHVDHGYYDKDKAPWEYENATLHCLCEYCHEDIHERRAILQMLLGHCGPLMLDRIIGYVFGSIAVSFESDCDHTIATHSPYTLDGIADAAEIRYDELDKAITTTAGKVSMRMVQDLHLDLARQCAKERLEEHQRAYHRPTGKE